jgi:hypothetical protein
MTAWGVHNDYPGVAEPPLYVTLSARPPRLAVFLPLAENVPWHRTYELALAAQSRLWGGSGNLILPASADIADNELFWALAERFDADYFAVATFTYGDMRLVNPEWYDEWLANQEQAMDRDIPEAGSEDRAALIERMLDDVAFAWAPPDGFLELLERRLAPFHRERPASYLLPSRIAEARAPGGSHPFADVTQIRGWPEQVANPETELGSLAQLLLTAHSGRLSAGYAASLVESEKTRVAPYAVNDRRQWADVVFAEPPPGVLLPWGLTELGLGWYRQGRWDREHVVLVTGGTPWDFTLYHALRRWASATFWLPQDLTEDSTYTGRLETTLFAASQASEEREVKVVTFSDDTFRDKVTADLQGRSWRVAAVAADWRDVLPARPHRLLERDGPGRAEPVAVHEGATVELATPVPASVETARSGHFRWLTEVRAAGWASVRHGELGTAVLDQPGFDGDNARTGRSGVVYTSTGALTFVGDSLAMSTVRPLLRPLPLLAQLDTALRADGWSCQGSDNGAYAAESAALFGGFRPLAHAILDSAVRPVLEAFRASEGPGKRAADRRYLTLPDVVEVLGGDEDKAGQVVDSLTSARVLTRGLFLKCSKCRAAGWYDLSSVTSLFRCRRCRDEQSVTRERWLGTVEPVWHYELAEVVHSLLDNNGDLPVVAVHRFFPEPERPSDDIEVAFEIEVFSSDEIKSETDIAVRDGSSLWVGEATTKPYLDAAGREETSRLSRLSEIADRLAATGVLLASSTEFRAKTRNRATSQFGGSRPRLCIEENIQTAA